MTVVSTKCATCGKSVAVEIPDFFARDESSAIAQCGECSVQEMVEDGGSVGQSPKTGNVTAVTPGAVEVLERFNKHASDFVERSLSGDWGDCCAEDRTGNDDCLRRGAGMALGSYPIGEGVNLWVVTYFFGDHTESTVMLPEEY